MKAAAALIEDLRLTRQPLCRWRNPIAKAKDLRNRVGPDFEKRRSEKKLYLPPTLEYLRSKELIDGNELSLITGIADKSRRNWYVDRYIVPLQTTPELILRFCDVEQALLKELPSGFPIFDKRSGLKFSEALCVVPKNFTHCVRSDSPCLITAVSIHQVNQRLGSAIKHGKSSVFSRAGITLPDGSDVSLTTGVFRHTLNTMAQASGLEQVQIALWSGRADPAQNASYDHVPAEDLLREVDVLFDLD
jgi:hypothetical protein